MKETDFLPEWYKETRRRQVSLRRQYVALAVVFTAMITYNLTATHSISKATVQLARAEPRRAEAENTLYELTKIKHQTAQLQKKARSIEQIDSKIDVAAVLAEMSFLVDRNIVLRQIEFVAEPFASPTKDEQKQSSVVRVAGTTQTAKPQAFLGDIRFKIVMTGVAADQSHVAALICKLEDSPYFQLVYPSFSRNVKLQPGAKTAAETPIADVDTPPAKTADALQASEFELSCYLSNYYES